MNSHKLLTYALSADNRLMYINDVQNGIECNCICPGCKEKLIAKNDGKIREHHFAHSSNKECATGYQTMVHLLAKAIIVNKRILPGFGINNKPIIASQIGCEVRLDDLNIIPDILAIAPVQINYNFIGSIQKNIPFIIEIFVTHKVDDNKAKVIKEAGIPAIEINLSKSETTTAEDLIKEIYNPANWNYINKDIGKQFIPRININLPNLAGLLPSTYPLRQHCTKRSYSGYRKSYKRRK